MGRVLQSRIFQRFWEVAGSVSISIKVLGIVLSMVLILGLSVTIQIRQILQPTLTDQLHQQGIAIGDQLATNISPLLTEGDLETIQIYLSEWREHYSDERHDTPIDSITIVNTEGEVIAQVDNPAPTHPDAVMDITIPLQQGILHLGLSEGLVQNTVNSITRQLTYTTLVMVVVGFAVAAFLTWVITRPILGLVEATQAVARGDFSYRVPRWANDEIGELAVAFNAMTEALARADEEHKEQERLRAQFVSAVIDAQEDERKRIALELHDSTSQSLTSLLVGLRNLEGLTEPDALKSHTENLRKQVAAILEEVHRLAWQLRPSTLDDLGLSAAIQRHLEDYRNLYQLQVDFVMRGITRLPPEMETSIYRIIQEALTNMVRHARAKSGSILIEQREDHVRVIVEDNGVGFDPALVASKERSLGLKGIQERARLFGGKMIIESAPNRGTSLFVELPHDFQRRNQ